MQFTWLTWWIFLLQNLLPCLNTWILSLSASAGVLRCPPVIFPVTMNLRSFLSSWQPPLLSNSSTIRTYLVHLHQFHSDERRRTWTKSLHLTPPGWESSAQTQAPSLPLPGGLIQYSNNSVLSNICCCSEKMMRKKRPPTSLLAASEISSPGSIFPQGKYLDFDHKYNYENVRMKHCQRHNGPEGWVHLAKATSWGHITSSNTNLDHISSSESRLSIS